jgi:hypothetical protein
MGMIDSFYDEDSSCPNCGAKLVRDWQTKHLQRLNESWLKGDFLQYSKLSSPREGLKRKRGKQGPARASSQRKEYASDAPLLFNGRVPVHQTCDGCRTRLVAYARILDGRFTSITEIGTHGEERDLIIARAEATARSLRIEFATRLSSLQESCRHEASAWMPFEWAPGHLSGRVRVCNGCEKILESDSGGLSKGLGGRCLIHGTLKEESGFCPRCAEEWP